jgi:hypothetical protein
LFYLHHSGIRRNDEINIVTVFLKYARQWISVAAAVFLLSGLLSRIVVAQPVTPFFSANQSPVIQVHNLPAIGNAGVLGDGRARFAW